MPAQFRFKVEIDGADAAEEMLRGIGERGHEAKPVLRIIQRLMLESAEAQFASKGARGGSPWLPDKPDTVAKKLEAGYPKDTEIMTGDLFDALTSTSGGAGAIRRLSRTSTTVGTSLPYAIFQGHKRELLEITTEDADAWAERMVDYLLEGKT